MSYSRHYARFHPDTARHDVDLRALLLRWLSPFLPAEKPSSVLDVGCGRGYALKLLRELGFKNISGIEVDAGQVEFARGLDLNVTLVTDSSAFLRNHASSFDLILLMDVLEHLDAAHRSEILEAIRTALRPGGRLVCTVPNATSAVASYFRYVDYTHEVLFTLESLDFALSQSGLSVKCIGGAEFFFRPRFLFWLPTRRTLQWLLICMVRTSMRITYLAELGLERGWGVSLSPNLIAVACRE